jgi:hypothetical protein
VRANCDGPKTNKVMKKLTILSVAIAMIGLTVQAADGAKKAGKGPAVPADVLKKYDKNNDGKVNKDDNLSKEEMQAYRAEVKKAREAAGEKKDAPAK